VTLSGAKESQKAVSRRDTRTAFGVGFKRALCPIDRPRGESRYEVGKRSGAWIKIKLHLGARIRDRGYTESEGSRKHFGALLGGFCEGKKLKFVGPVGTGFSEKLLRSLRTNPPIPDWATAKVIEAWNVPGF
jgi:hypothetical protein